jgi:peptide deformylase
MNLIYYPNDFLNKKVKDFNLENPEVDPKELKDNMVQIMLDNNGIGLAANQVEFDGQVFVMGDTAENATIHINPVVLQHTKDTVTDVEGCLSFPNIFVKVTRPKEILVQFYDENLKLKQAKIGGYSAKCFLHEYDHLQGITFKDRVSKLKWNMAEKKAKKYEKVQLG